MLVITFIAGEFYARSMYTPTTDMHFQMDCFEKQADEIEVLILGSSHAAKGIHPAFLTPKAFNLAYSNQDAYYNNRLLQKYIPQLKRLKTLILSLSWQSFVLYESEPEIHLIRDYWITTGIYPRYDLTLKAILASSVFYFQRSHFLEDLFEGKKPTRFFFLDKSKVPEDYRKNFTLLNNGFRYSIGSMSNAQLESHAKSNFKVFKRLYNETRISQNVHLTSSLIELAFNKGVRRVVLITPPTTKFYRKTFKKRQPEFFDNHLTFLLERFKGYNIQYFDFSGRKEFSQNLFLNSDHLNYKGAELFTKMLNKQLFLHTGSRSE